MRKRARILLALTVVPVFASGMVRAQDARQGAKIAERLCAPCHAVKPGMINRHPTAPRFEDIPRRYSVWDLSEALAEGILVGHDAMPRFKLEPKEIRDLLTYMDSFAKPKPNAR